MLAWRDAGKAGPTPSDFRARALALMCLSLHVHLGLAPSAMFGAYGMVINQNQLLQLAQPGTVSFGAYRQHKLSIN